MEHQMPHRTNSDSADTYAGQVGVPGLDPVFDTGVGASRLPLLWLTNDKGSTNQGQYLADNGAIPYPANPSRAGAIASAGATSTPTVTTDADDYAPGSTAYITAQGFRIGAEINFAIEVIDPETHAHLWT